MSDVLEIRLQPGHPDGYDRLRRIINLQEASDRMARWRRAWTALSAVASIPLALFAFQRAPGRQLAGWSFALWATALLAAAGAALKEWKLRRRLEILIAEADAGARR
jgi:hypothetical protein